MDSTPALGTCSHCGGSGFNTTPSWVKGTDTAKSDVIGYARVADAVLESLIDSTDVEMWVRVFHDKLHGALRYLDEISQDEPNRPEPANARAGER